MGAAVQLSLSAIACLPSSPDTMLGPFELGSTMVWANKGYGSFVCRSPGAAMLPDEVGGGLMQHAIRKGAQLRRWHFVGDVVS